MRKRKMVKYMGRIIAAGLRDIQSEPEPEQLIGSETISSAIFASTFRLGGITKVLSMGD